jgi:hypothetical protein
MAGMSFFVRGFTTYVARGHCSTWVLNLHGLECHYCKNGIRRNNDLGLHQCNNDLQDVARTLGKLVFSNEYNLSVLFNLHS